MVKYLLSRQNTKTLKGYKMSPDTTPLYIANSIASQIDISVMVPAALVSVNACLKE
jgi:hypothetical protein